MSDTLRLRQIARLCGLFACEYLAFLNLPGDLGNSRGMSPIASGQYEVFVQKGDITLAKRKPRQ